MLRGSVAPVGWSSIVVGYRERRYSDSTDVRWALIEPLLRPGKTGGRPEKHRRRDIVDVTLYVVGTG